MTDNIKPPPRSAGSLTIGQPIYSNGIFAVDMTFKSATSDIDEDDMKSAMLACARQFRMLLARNGFWDVSEPRTTVRRLDKKTAVFAMACQASGKKPTPAKITMPGDDTKH